MSENAKFAASRRRPFSFRFTLLGSTTSLNQSVLDATTFRSFGMNRHESRLLDIEIEFNRTTARQGDFRFRRMQFR